VNYPVASGGELGYHKLASGTESWEVTMLSRRLLRLTGTVAGLRSPAVAVGSRTSRPATAAVETRSPEELATDEAFWREISFAVRRSLWALPTGPVGTTAPQRSTPVPDHPQRRPARSVPVAPRDLPAETLHA
jgi:hypothetical protein